LKNILLFPVVFFSQKYEFLLQNGTATKKLFKFCIHFDFSFLIFTFVTCYLFDC